MLNAFFCSGLVLGVNLTPFQQFPDFYIATNLVENRISFCYFGCFIYSVGIYDNLAADKALAGEGYSIGYLLVVTDGF